MNQTPNAITMPETLSGFIYNRVNGIILSSLGEEHARENLNEIGEIVNQFYGTLQGTPVTDVRIAFEEVVITARPLDSDNYMIILSDPDVDEKKITTEIERHLLSLKRTYPPVKTPPKRPQVISPELIEKQIRSGPVSKQLQELSTPLFQCVGPVAKVIFRDAVRQWLGEGPASKERLGILVGIVTHEIRNPEKADEYRAKLPRYLASLETK